MNMDQKAVMIEFADKHLFPYKIREHGEKSELIPEFCPFCNGGANGKDKETFALSLDKGVYCCKRGGCGKHGRFEELADFFGEQISLGRADNILHQPKNAYSLPETVKKPPTEAIYRYFESRKISRATVDACKVMSDEKGMIVFPFYENGVDVFEKFRRPWKPRPDEKGKEWRSPGTKPILWGMDDCSFSHPLIITEGEIDAMSLREAGITNVASVPSGCEDMAWIELCWDWLEKFKTIILFGDNDEPGRKMVREVAKRLDESRCMLVEDYPSRPDGTPCKDANEILYFHGEFELISMVENAASFPVRGLIDLSTVTPIDPTTVHRIKTMIPALDSAIGGLVEGGVTIFTGKAGNGKSTLTGQLLLSAIDQGIPCAAYSGELTKEKFQEWINLQAAGSEYIGLKYDKIRGCQVPTVPYEVQKRIMSWYAGKLFLFDNNELFETNQAHAILDVFTMAMRKFGCKLFLVDNMMTSLADIEEETRAQARFINALKKFATRYGVHVIAVAHPRKTKAGETLRNDDLSGSSSIGNMADTVIVVERPNLRITKNRDGGKQILIECVYCPDSRRIYQMDAGDQCQFGWDRTDLPLANPRADSLPEYGIQIAPREPF